MESTPWRQKIRHDVKKYEKYVSHKKRHDVEKYIHNDVKKFVITSKSMESTSCVKKVRHDVMNYERQKVH